MVAEELEWSRFKTYRWMLSIEAAFPGVVQRTLRGRLIADARAIGPHITSARGTPADHETQLLRDRVRDLETRLDAEIRERQAFRALSHEWFSRIEALEKKQPHA
jgi:hypothetical protein